MFLINSWQENFHCGPACAGQALSLTYGRFFAEFLEDLGDGVVAYLDEDVLNLLLTDEDESVSVAVQTQFAVQTLFVIAKQISQEMTAGNKELQELNPESGALRFIMRMADECKVDANDLLELALKNESKLQAMIESRFGLATKLQKLLKGN